MISHVGTDIYKDAVWPEISSNTFKFFGFVEFSDEVMRLKKITTIADKEAKDAAIFRGRHENSFDF